MLAIDTRTRHRGPRRRMLGALLVAVALLIAPAATATPVDHHVLTDGLGSGSGSTVGPDGALYVAAPASGTIFRVDRRSGSTTTFATGFPLPLIRTGGVMDVEFIGATAYALVTLVAPDVGGSDVVGIYRIDGPSTHTPIVDIGSWSAANQPDEHVIVPSGVQYAMQEHRGGLIVTDGHHNRVLAVSLDGEISEIVSFENEVPTGLDIRGNKVFLAKAGPVPHTPEDGQVVSFTVRGHAFRHLASGARLAVDVEFGPHARLYVLSQGIHTSGIEGTPADPDTGTLFRRTPHGLEAIAEHLDRPTSIEIVGNTAYVVMIDGEVWSFPYLSKRH